MRHVIRFRLFRLPGGGVPHVDWIHMVISFRVYLYYGRGIMFFTLLSWYPCRTFYLARKKLMTKKRDYKREYAQYHSKPEQKKNRAMRNTARRQAIAEHGKAALKGKDVDHIKPLSRGGTNAKSNRRIVSTHINRARNLRSKRSS